MSLLEIKHLQKKFDQNAVLNDISFSLEQGEVLSIIGPSGSGKTTILRCLVGLDDPTHGEIILNGKTIFNDKLHKERTEEEIRQNRLSFGIVFQNFNLFPQYTALENVTLARLLNMHKTHETKEAILQDGINLLKQMGLENKKDFYPQKLSGGQQQRVAIARALSLNPSILCFDEPTSALDPELTGEVLRVIRGLADKHTSMIIVTHEMSFARDVSNTTIFIDKGIIVEQGESQEFFAHPKEERTKMFLSNYHNNLS